jgi:FKBP-type peptidyl-prolyl cis-trans isomerase FklB
MKLNSLALALTAGLMGVALAAESGDLKDPKQKSSYALGMTLGANLKRTGADLDQIDPDFMVRGLKDALTSGKTLLTDAESREVVMAFQREARKSASDKNKAIGENFLAENKKKDGVMTLPSGLQYKHLVEGKGDSPKTNDVVTVNYKGSLIDGTEFDSSYKRGQPATFSLGGVIEGWKQGLQLMKPGGKSQLFIPAALAYQERGSGSLIGPNAALVFEVELISIKSSQAVQAEPVTSDIVKVPSADELKAGAKIEVIKAADIEKLKAAEKEKADKAKTEQK